MVIFHSYVSLPEGISSIASLVQNRRASSLHPRSEPAPQGSSLCTESNYPRDPQIGIPMVFAKIHGWSLVAS